MKTQQMYYEKAQEWLEAEELPTEKELAELEALYQEWIDETFDKTSQEWDWDLNPTAITTDDEIEAWQMSLQEGLEPEWARSQESDEDLYTDLAPDWDEYEYSGRLY